MLTTENVIEEVNKLVTNLLKRNIIPTTRIDARRKVNILAGDSIGHGKKKVYMNMRVIINGYREEAV